MSDIEDYAYSPYDDLEDILYDADPAPELADDLADHAVHSPVYDVEVAGYELEDYYSDWEYYSDDYMDDDPVLLRQNPQDGSPARRPGKDHPADKSGTATRGRKRKLVDTMDIPPLDLSDTDLITRCIKGTVWARHADQAPPAYKVGQGIKVSLMKNWKELFAIADDGWGRGAAAKKDDESWAKDMSLADMGLQNLQRQKSFEQGTPAQESEYADDGEDEDDDGAEGEDYDEDDDTGMANLDEDAALPSTDHRPRLALVNGEGEPAEAVGSMLPPSNIAHADERDEGETVRKRRRFASDARPSSDSAHLPATPREHPDISRAHRDNHGAGASAGLTPPEITSDPATNMNGFVASRHKKRKASDEPEVDSDGDSQPTTSSTRAKRVASRPTSHQSRSESRVTRSTRKK